MSTQREIKFDSTYYPVLLTSGIVAYIIFKFIFPTLSSKLVPAYNSFSPSLKISWNNLLISSFHSIVACFVCVLGFVLEENINSDPIWCDCPIVKISCAIVAGYLLQDILMMFIYWTEIGGVLYVCHHAASVYAYLYVMSYGVVPWFANFRLLAEFSTVFVNNRWFFDTLKMKRTQGLPLINGILMTVSFFLARIAAMPVYWHKVYTVHGTQDFDDVGRIKYVLYGTCGALDSLNIYWFYKMCKGLAKALTQGQKVVEFEMDSTRLKLE